MTKKHKGPHWNHRVIKQKLVDGTDWFSVREVFYNADGSIFSYTVEPVDIDGDSIESIRQYLQWCLNSLDAPILNEDEILCKDDENL